jgi:flagellar biogenesis protein FliO
MTFTDMMLILFGVLVFLIGLIIVLVFLVERHDPNFFVAPYEDDELRFDEEDYEA